MLSRTSETIVTLGLTFYLIGLAAGSVVVAPLSETYGRKPVCVISLFIFVLMIIPCGLATSVTELIIVRFISAVAGSVMVSSAPGMVSDLVDDDNRALALSVWSIGPINGPGRWSSRRYVPMLLVKLSDALGVQFWAQSSAVSLLSIWAGGGRPGLVSFSQALLWFFPVS